MKRISITVNKVNDEQKESDYLEEIKAELKRLETFRGDWKKKNDEVIYYGDWFCSVERFIRLGGVQKALIGIAFFQQGYDNVAGLSLHLKNGMTWKDVLDSLREIESIEI